MSAMEHLHFPSLNNEHLHVLSGERKQNTEINLFSSHGV